MNSSKMLDSTCGRTNIRVLTNWPSGCGSDLDVAQHNLGNKNISDNNISENIKLVGTFSSGIALGGNTIF